MCTLDGNWCEPICDRYRKSFSTATFASSHETGITDGEINIIRINVVENCAFVVAVRRLYQSILHFQRSYTLNVILFTFQRKVQPFLV
jgi:hypothetical protein